MSNLLKGYYTKLQGEEVRVIDANSLMEKRMHELEEHSRQLVPEMFQDGFVQGLQAEKLEVAPGDENASGNVIKAQEDMKLLVEQASEQAKHILEDAQEEAASIRSEAIRQAEAECGFLKEEAKKQGYEEGSYQAAQELKQEKAQLDAHIRQIESEYQQMVETLEPHFIETITGIYEHIFHVDLEAYRDILVYLMNDAMRKTEGSRNFLIHVSKEDYPYINMQKKQITAGIASATVSVEIVEDLTVGKNECLIEADGGILNCGVGVQLSQLRQKLLLLSYQSE